MVQPVLFFLLGLLTAGFLAVLVMPAVSRRAAALARRRMEATLAQTPAEIEAEKDGIRASFALSARRLEMEGKALGERLAAQAVELGRAEERIKALAAEGQAKDNAFAALQAEKERAEAALAERDGQLRDLADRIGAMERTMAERAAEFKKLGRMYDEASFSSSSRQIELVAREAELEKLGASITSLRARHKEAEARRAEALSESKAARDALKAERKKAADLEKKLERLMATLADRDDRLERREKEISRLRGQSSKEGGGEEAGADGDADRGRERLEARLVALMRENKRLKAGQASADLSGQDAALREEMQRLAAEVVGLVARLDGPDSPVARAISGPGRAEGGRVTSLAERVRALREAEPGR